MRTNAQSISCRTHQYNKGNNKITDKISQQLISLTSLLQIAQVDGFVVGIQY
jgi:hypothetical protein